MAKVNMINGDGEAFTTSLKRSREMVQAGTATLAPAKVVKKAAAKKAPAKKATKQAAKRTYNTRALKAK